MEQNGNPSHLSENSIGDSNVSPIGDRSTFLTSNA